MRWYYNQCLLNCDGRFSSCVEHLLVAQYATELKQIQGNIVIALCLQRGTSTHGRRLTACMLQNPQTVQHLIYKEQAYKCLNSVHGTPQYWQKMLYETLAMLRTFGTPMVYDSLCSRLSVARNFSSYW